jgi:cytochrome P450
VTTEIFSLYIFIHSQSLPYLDMVINETLRRHPPIGMLMRRCVKDFSMEGFEIKKGLQLFIPVAGIHMDPKYYPEPEKFNPEHFNKENKAKRNP